MSWLVEKFCAKCDKQMTIREASSHNKHPDYDGEVCYRCYRDWYQNRPITQSDYVSPELQKLLAQARKG